MLIEMGKYHNHTLEWLILNDPKYFYEFLTTTGISENASRLKEEAYKLISIFDRKPFIRTCSNFGCRRSVVRFTLALHNTHVSFWCENCLPKLGWQQYTISTFSTFMDIVKLLYSYSKPKVVMTTIVREIARCKGLPKRAGEKEAAEFFSTS